MGYMRSTRWDGRVDANRDFPYSRNNDRCFQSSSARLFKALMETNIIQTVVTFHGGMVALGYEWGSRNHNRPKDQSPDENAHRSIGELMGAYAGTFAGEKPYPGTTSALVQMFVLTTQIQFNTAFALIVDPCYWYGLTSCALSCAVCV